jgi:hypothetical protein
MTGRFLRPFVWSGAPFGVVLGGIEFLLLGTSPAGALGTGALYGAMFGGAMASLNASRWIRDWVRRNTAPSLEDRETILLDGFANRHGHGGFLYLTDRRLYFTAHPLNVGSGEWSVARSEIDAAVPERTLGGLIPNGLRLTLTSGEEELLTTWERERWSDALNDDRRA